MDKIERLYKYLPINNVDFELIKKELLYPFVDDLFKTMQEKKWHAEGDVLTHTSLVLDALISLKEYQELNKIEQRGVFMSALFHDIGKIPCTKVIDGEIRSFYHGAAGAKMLREYLWKDLELAGEKEYQEFIRNFCFYVNHLTGIQLHKPEEKFMTVDEFDKAFYKLLYNGDGMSYTRLVEYPDIKDEENLIKLIEAGECLQFEIKNW